MTVSPNVIQHKMLSLLCYKRHITVYLGCIPGNLVKFLNTFNVIICSSTMPSRQKGTYVNLCMHKCMYHEALALQNQIPTSCLSIVLLEGNLPENLCQYSLFGIKFLHRPCDSVSSNIKQQSWSTLALTVQQLNNLLKIHYKITLCRLHCTLVIMPQDDIIA